MNKTNKLTVPDLISIGVFTALYFVLVTIATFASVAIFPGFNNVVLPAFCALIVLRKWENIKVKNGLYLVMFFFLMGCLDR